MPNLIREAYDRWARTYDSMPNGTRDLDEELLRKGLSDVPLGEILEAGCGTGKNTKWLANQGKVVGLDFSSKMLAKCRSAVPAAELYVADLTSVWPLDENTVDTVVINLVLEHIFDLEHIACEAARVLRSGGLVRISELHPYRQFEGSGARFADEGVTVKIPTFIHTTEEYVGTFLRLGFVLQELCEPHLPNERGSQSPRLLIMSFSLPHASGAG